MNWQLFVLFAAAFAPFSLSSASSAKAQDASRVTGPVSHENLAIYFVRGPSAPGPVPLTLNEALMKGNVVVHETGSVNRLQIENLSDEEVFIQAGDIVKGGKQDRVLTVSLLLSAKSGNVPIDAFCVEKGRWSARAAESTARFASAAQALPSREAKIAMMAPSKPADAAAAAPALQQSAGRHQRVDRGANADRAVQQARGYDETGSRQQKVWDSVGQIQSKLSSNLKARVASELSASSLQLSLENEKLIAARAAYVAALKAAGEQDDDIIGYVVAINGKVSSADVYPSNGLFRKMWPKLLDASATEAIGDKGSVAAPAPGIDGVQAFLANADKAKADAVGLDARLTRESRDADHAMMFATTRKAGGFVHRTYLAK
jgi:hypothetical protein